MHGSMNSGPYQRGILGRSGSPGREPEWDGILESDARIASHLEPTDDVQD